MQAGSLASVLGFFAPTRFLTLSLRWEELGPEIHAMQFAVVRSAGITKAFGTREACCLVASLPGDGGGYANASRGQISETLDRR